MAETQRPAKRARCEEEPTVATAIPAPIPDTIETAVASKSLTRIRACTARMGTDCITATVLAGALSNPLVLSELLRQLPAATYPATSVAAFRFLLPDGATVLHRAAAQSTDAAALSVELLLKHRVRVDGPGPTTLSPLCVAAMHGHVGVARQLLQGDADVNFRCVIEQMTPLQWACVGSRFQRQEQQSQPADAQRALDTVELLCQHGATVRARSATGTAVVFAAGRRDRRMLRYLLDRGGSINSAGTVPGDGARSPLHMAAAAGRPDNVRELLGRGAKVGPRAGIALTRRIMAAATGWTKEGDDELMTHADSTPAERQSCFCALNATLTGRVRRALRLFVWGWRRKQDTPMGRLPRVLLMRVCSMVDQPATEFLAARARPRTESLLQQMLNSPAPCEWAVKQMLRWKLPLLPIKRVAWSPKGDELVHTLMKRRNVRCPDRDNPCTNLYSAAAASEGDHSGCARLLLQLKCSPDALFHVHASSTNVYPLPAAALNKNPWAREVARELISAGCTKGSITRATS
jgi:hypothetical protein